jgi:hypothetical protein
MFVICKECGAPMSDTEIEQGSHQCSFEQMVAFQTQCARIELERGLSAQVELWEQDPRLSRRLEFARYLRARSERRGAATASDGRRRPVRLLHP